MQQSILIGAGTTGIRVLQRLQEFQKVSPEQHSPTLLGLDERLHKSPSWIGRLAGEEARSLCQAATAGRAEIPFLKGAKETVPINEIDTKTAGGERWLGRLALVESLSMVRAVLRQKLQNGRDREEDGAELEVALIASTCGGTGSSLLADLSTLIRAIQRPRSIALYLLLPPMCDVPEKGAANTYATLKEIFHLTYGSLPFSLDWLWPDLPECKFDTSGLEFWQRTYLFRPRSGSELAYEDAISHMARSLSIRSSPKLDSEIRTETARFMRLSRRESPDPERRKRLFSACHTFLHTPLGIPSSHVANCVISANPIGAAPPPQPPRQVLPHRPPQDPYLVQLCEIHLGGAVVDVRRRLLKHLFETIGKIRTRVVNEYAYEVIDSHLELSRLEKAFPSRSREVPKTENGQPKENVDPEADNEFPNLDEEIIEEESANSTDPLPNQAAPLETSGPHIRAEAEILDTFTRSVDGFGELRRALLKMLQKAPGQEKSIASVLRRGFVQADFPFLSRDTSPSLKVNPGLAVSETDHDFLPKRRNLAELLQEQQSLIAKGKSLFPVSLGFLRRFWFRLLDFFSPPTHRFNVKDRAILLQILLEFPEFKKATELYLWRSILGMLDAGLDPEEFGEKSEDDLVAPSGTGEAIDLDENDEDPFVEWKENLRQDLKRRVKIFAKPGAAHAYALVALPEKGWGDADLEAIGDQIEQVVREELHCRCRRIITKGDRVWIYHEDLFHGPEEILGLDDCREAYEQIGFRQRLHTDLRWLEDSRFQDICRRKRPTLLHCGNHGCDENIAGLPFGQRVCPGCKSSIRSRCGNSACDGYGLDKHPRGRDLQCPFCGQFNDGSWWQCHRHGKRQVFVPTDKKLCPECTVQHQQNPEGFPKDGIGINPNLWEGSPCPNCEKIQKKHPEHPIFKIPTELLPFYQNGVNGHSMSGFLELTKRLNMPKHAHCPNCQTILIPIVIKKDQPISAEEATS